MPESRNVGWVFHVWPSPNIHLSKIHGNLYSIVGEVRATCKPSRVFFRSFLGSPKIEQSEQSGIVKQLKAHSGRTTLEAVDDVKVEEDKWSRTVTWTLRGAVMGYPSK